MMLADFIAPRFLQGLRFVRSGPSISQQWTLYRPGRSQHYGVSFDATPFLGVSWALAQLIESLPVVAATTPDGSSPSRP